MRQKRVPLSRKSFPKRGCLVGYGRNPKMILSQRCIDFHTKTYRFGHISGPSYRGSHAGWPGGWLVRRMPAMRLGHEIASKTRTLSAKVRQKRVPLSRKSVSKRQKRIPFINKCVKTAYPLPESRRRNEGRPRGVWCGGGQKCEPFIRKCVKNAYP